jgi:hypothetical protein
MKDAPFTCQVPMISLSCISFVTLVEPYDSRLTVNDFGLDKNNNGSFGAVVNFSNGLGKLPNCTNSFALAELRFSEKRLLTKNKRIAVLIIILYLSWFSLKSGLARLVAMCH